MSDALPHVIPPEALSLVHVLTERVSAAKAAPTLDPGAWARAVAAAQDSVTNPPPVLTADYFNPLGTALFYGGVLNTLVGPGGMMKTTLALLAASNHAGYTLFISLEKSRPALLNSARWVGADTSRLLIATDVDEAEAIIGSAPPSADLLVVVDSTLSLLGRFGWNEDSASDVGALEARLMGWYGTGNVACVVLIDHMGHTPGRARGSSRKGQMVQGRIWTLTKQSGGSVLVRCEKDNSGEAGLPWSYDMTPTGPVVSLQTLAQPVEAVALSACGIAPGTGVNAAWQAVKAHLDYPAWKAQGLTHRRLRAALSPAHSGLFANENETDDPDAPAWPAAAAYETEREHDDAVRRR